MSIGGSSTYLDREGGIFLGYFWQQAFSCEVVSTVVASGADGEVEIKAGMWAQGIGGFVAA